MDVLFSEFLKTWLITNKYILPNDFIEKIDDDIKIIVINNSKLLIELIKKDIIQEKDILGSNFNN